MYATIDAFLKGLKRLCSLGKNSERHSLLRTVPKTSTTVEGP